LIKKIKIKFLVVSFFSILDHQTLDPDPGSGSGSGSGTDAHPERARKELMRTLSIRISSLRACSACASVFMFFKCSFCIPQHARKKLMRALSMRVRN
jgi:hypothetical protein